MSPSSPTKQPAIWNRPYLIALIALAVITAVGAWLRLTDLGVKSLWMDEYLQAFFVYTFRLDELLHVTLFRGNGNHHSSIF